MTDFDGFKQVLVKRHMINTAFSRVEQVHCSLLACLEENEEREKADESFMIQVERRQNFMERLDSWIKRAEARTEQSVPHVGPEDSISQSGASKSSRSRASSGSNSSSAIRLREAKERRGFAQLKLQQLEQTQGLERKKMELNNEEEKAKLLHEYELATLSEQIWTETEDPTGNYPSGSKALPSSNRPGFQQSEIPTAPVLISQDSVPMPSDQSIPRGNPTVTMQRPPKTSGLNPNAPRWMGKSETKSQTSGSLAYGNENAQAAGPYQQNVEVLVQFLTYALNEGFNLPKAEILTFDGNPLEYWKFIHNFEVNIVGQTNDPRKRLTYLIQHCTGEAREVIENCCILDSQVGYKKARDIFCIISLAGLMSLLKRT